MSEFPIGQLEFENGGINLYFYTNEKLNRRVNAKSPDHFHELINSAESDSVKLVLECSTKGDKRFSAFGARIKVFGLMDVIEFHYQLSKRVQGVSYPEKLTWTQKMQYIKLVKGRTPDSLSIKGRDYSPTLLSEWYDLLWCKYLDSSPVLVEYLKLFNDFNDVFKGKSMACQADSIRKYIQEGRGKVLSDCQTLLNEMRGIS